MNNELKNNLLKTLSLTEQLKNAARDGLSKAVDDDSIFLFGLIKDNCYKIKQEVNKELTRLKGKESY